MKGYRAVRAGSSRSILSALVLLAGLGLAGCSDVDEALFGTPDESDVAQSATPGTLPSGESAPQQQQSAAASPAYGQPQQESDETQPEGAAPAESGEPGTLPAQNPAPAPMAGSAAGVAPVAIAPGANTGTAVSATIASLRGQAATIESNLASNAQQYESLHAQAVANATAYHAAKARITARLQVGTTRGNPELVAEWNTAQTALDQLTGTINSLNALGTNVMGDSSSARSLLDQIAATFDVSGAVDEDHRQLTVLQDETSQTVILINRLLKNVSSDVQRQTADTANERASLTALADAIKNGELYGGGAGSSVVMGIAGSGPLVVIRFDRPNVDYQQTLYSALNQALYSRPNAAFSVVAVTPTRGSAAAVQRAQTAAKRHAREVLRAISEMGVPASRLQVASSTDPNATSSEVRVFVR